jgi:Domain of unknown function (DUF305)
MKKNRVDGTAVLAPVLASLSHRGVRHLIPDVSLRTGKGLASLAAAALIGVATSLGAIWAAAGPGQAPMLAAYVFSLCRSSLGAVPREDAPFMAENQATMATMMAGMNIRPSGEVDRDFVDMMVPHHQGAIDMARAVLRHGHDEKIRRLAQEIIVTQQQEIAVMRLAVGEPLARSIPSPIVPPAANGN